MARKISGLEETTVALPKFKGRTIQVLERLSAFAASLFSCECAALLLNQDGIKRIIADYGVPVRFRSFAFDFAGVPFERDERVIVHDAAGKDKYETLGREFGLPKLSFFLRAPISVTNDYALSLVIAGTAAQPKPDKRQLKLLAEIETLILAEFNGVAHLLTDASKDVTVAATLKDMTARVEGAAEPCALLDQDLKIAAINGAMASLLGSPKGSLVGLTHHQVGIPASDAVGFLLQRALQTRVSPPEFEIVSTPEGGGKRIFSLNVSPFSPTETTRYFLMVTAREVTSLEHREGLLSRKIASQAQPGTGKPVEPSLAFLAETLVSRRAIRERKSVNYLTLRSWRQPIRDYQMKALKALKQNIPDEMPALVAAEIAAEVTNLLGVSAFKAIVPIPCGHSKSETCLSVEIARALGANIGLPVI